MTQRSQFFKCKATERTMKCLLIQRLELNYELSEGVCLPRCLLYSHYLDFCRSSAMNPISAAAFGKVIRRRFSQITTRRLGTRGQSKYHYFGLAIKKSSQYYTDYLERFRQIKNKPVKVNSKRFKHRNEPRAMNVARKVLANFSKLASLSEVHSLSGDLQSFVFKIKTHYDDMIASIIHFNLNDAALSLNQFWLLDIHLVISDPKILISDFFVLLAEHIDFIFFEAIHSSLVPRTIKEITSPCLETINTLANEFENWLKPALMDMPFILLDRKIKACQLFTRPLKRYSSLLPLVKNCACLLNQRELLAVMMSDINLLDLDSIRDDFPLASSFKQTQVLEEVLLNLLLNLDQYSDMDKFFSSLNHSLVYLISSFQSPCIVTRATKFVLTVNRLIICLDRELTLNNVTTLNHWIKLLTIVRESSLLVAEDTIRKDSAEINKILLFRTSLGVDLVNYDACSSPDELDSFSTGL